ncbi:ATP-dependent Zn protease [Paramagnetospirillum kuznetsovii]|uniref:ATP-dependent Zn protease n=1 Tax=Paramagnetospirillum kuznetsovii TaxID=2053833 RepID=A0A364NYU5_9PROT|nr:AAA family ATPase [Paramagnetospirillum kuznetsovii]RAU22180.1 ATP-dependent Zn protease [Paramagnetospirillum kuznetsovii]
MKKLRPSAKKIEKRHPGDNNESFSLSDFPPEEEQQLPRDPGDVAARHMLDAALAAAPDVVDLARRNGVAIVVTVRAPWASLVAKAWADRFYDSQQMVNGDTATAAHIGRYTFPSAPRVAFIRDGETAAPRRDEASAVIATTLVFGGTVVGFAEVPAEHLPAALLESVDGKINVPPLDGNLLGTIITDITLTKPYQAIPNAIAGRIGPTDLRLVARPDQNADGMIHRLITMIDGRQKLPALTLDSMGGMVEAVAWGKALAKDLADYRDGKLDWSDVDRGVLLSGTPGTGKTTFARALAGTCGVPLVASSLGEWQSAGHLGDLLKAMRKTFTQARAMSPSILLVDEIDGFGSRTQFKSDYKDYSIQVVNAFLELLDGASARDGVVVVGATNNPDRIDPAITRAGRLDRHIQIGLPDQTALLQIFRHHLGSDLSNDDLAPAAMLALGGSGADVAKWIRGARRRGRQDRRPMHLDDLMAEIRGSAQTVSAEICRCCAVHEAGHALAIALHRPDAVKHVSIRQTGSTGGGVLSHRPEMELATSADIDQLLITTLAGRAAEELVLGQVSSGSGGGPDSDLARATMLATTAITALGLGGQSVPIWSGIPTPDSLDLLLIRRPDISLQVEDRIRRAYAAAMDRLTTNRTTLDLIVERLLEIETMSGEELAAIISMPFQRQGSA